MTHKDINTKFLIEYDKANVTSSYPALTKYEIATILDKAYLALINQKVTGNNQRQAPFEADLKAIEDIRPLIKVRKGYVFKTQNFVPNMYHARIPEDSMYIIEVEFNLLYGENRPMDEKARRSWPALLVSHETAQKFFATPYNMPWIKQPVYFMENGFMCFLLDSMWNRLYDIENMACIDIHYIHKPEKFVDNISHQECTEFELSDSMAEELINLAILMALENVESSRLQSKAQMRTLEA